MRRLLALLLAAGLAPDAAAQQKAADKPADKLAPEVQAAIEKAKAELREELTQKAQDQAAARAEAVPAGEGKKLNLFQISGYLRTRGDLFDDLSLRRSADKAGYTLYPVPASSPGKGTLTSGNLRLRLEPVLNVSDEVRLLAQVDALDGILLGQDPGRPASDPRNADRDSIRLKRAWGEVQLPVGLASFGRMPASWGVGMVANAGSGLDDDLGDTVDRLQLAIPVRQLPVFGSAVFVPYYQVNSTGITSAQTTGGNQGSGQPLDLDKADDNWSAGIRAVRLDTEEELRRKLDRGESSWNYGLWYQYTSQRYALTYSSGQAGNSNLDVSALKVGSTSHLVDFWLRYRNKKLRLELEVAGTYGNIDDGRRLPTDPLLGPVAVRQLGGVLQGDYRFLDGRLTAGGEVGFASGDKTPGMGNHPERGFPVAGSIDGLQYTGVDKAIRNFRFNPAYRVDLILWRELLGNVTDTWYLKPSLRYDVLDGLSLQAAVIYSQAIFAESTPSSTHRPLGIELDTGVHYASADGFHLWLDWGVLQPLDGFNYAPDDNSARVKKTRAHALRSGIAIKF